MNCKPGDLAIITRSRHPRNIGRIVEVMQPSKRFDGVWLCRAVGSPITATYVRSGDQVRASLAEANDADLRPVSGLPLDADESLAALA